MSFSIYDPNSFNELQHNLQVSKYGCNVTKDFLKKILNYEYLDSSHIIFYLNLFKDMINNERVWAFNSHFFEDVTPCLSIQIDLNDMELPRQPANRSGGGPGGDGQRSEKDGERKKPNDKSQHENEPSTEGDQFNQTQSSIQSSGQNQIGANTLAESTICQHGSEILKQTDEQQESKKKDDEENNKQKQKQNSTQSAIHPEKAAQSKIEEKNPLFSQIIDVRGQNTNFGMNFQQTRAQGEEKQKEEVVQEVYPEKAAQSKIEEKNPQVSQIIDVRGQGMEEEQVKQQERDAAIKNQREQAELKKKQEDQARIQKQRDDQLKRKKEEEEKERQKQEEISKMAQKFSIKIGPIKVVEQEKGKIRWLKVTEYFSNVKSSIKVSSLEEIQNKLDLIFFPINLDNSHWVSACIDVKDKKIRHFDSLGGSPNRLIHNALFVIAIRDLNISVEEFKAETRNESSCQQNNYDCGIFVLLSLLKVMNPSFDYDQARVSKFRHDKLYRLATRAIFDDLNKETFDQILRD